MKEWEKENGCLFDRKVYTGDIYAEKKHGNGVLSWSDGRMFTGTFFADKRHGFGVDHTPNTSEFKVSISEQRDQNE